MVIELTGLGEGETQWSKTVGPEEIELVFPDYTFAEPVGVRLSITNVENQYILKGRATTHAQTRCVKCLQEFGLRVEEEIGWAVQAVSDPALIADQEEAEDFWFIDRNENHLEIGPRVRETILISLPANPLCRPDCRGLCPHCGADLNQGPCGCGEKETDGRWTPLQHLLNPGKNSNAE